MTVGKPRAQGSEERRSLSFTLAFLVVTLLCVPTPAAAQWVEAPGHGWVQLSVYHHVTRERFAADGGLEPLFNEEGQSVTTSVFLTGTVGVVRGVDLWAQVPYHRLEFNDVAAARSNAGLSDPRVYVRVGAPAVGRDWPVAVRAGVKLPAGAFDRDAEIIPIGEGQRDVELIAEAGTVFPGTPLYAMGWLGYRWRARNDETGFEPGDEAFALVGLGESEGRVAWKLVAEGFYGFDPTQRVATGQELTLSQERRELLQLLPTVGWNVGPGTAELGLRLPLAGRNMPSGPALTVGYFLRWR